MTDTALLRVLVDNPADLDLLGLAPIATAARDIVCADNTEPVTVGLHGPWGSGKSSLLIQLRQRLMNEPNTIVFDLNPWEFSEDEDVKSVIISTVLAQLAQGAQPALLDRIRELAKRVSWKRATEMVSKGALMMTGEPTSVLSFIAETFDFVKDVRADGGGRTPPTTLTGFRDEFATLMKDLDADRVVVLVDDLDRCLPTAVLSTLEAIKLFLAVPKMAFVIAADQHMVREAITAGLGETRRSSVFARDYLDKIVQVPITVPQPTSHDAECYVALLLAHRDAHGSFDLGAHAQHADGRRATGTVPYLAGMKRSGATPAHLQQAKLIVAGLGADDVVNPRRMKRFVNALAVREHAARASSVELDSEIIAKLFMLEHRFMDQMRVLASLGQHERTARITAWEAWAREEREGVSPGTPEPELRLFFAAKPHLADRDIERYFVLARRLIKSTLASGLTEEAHTCLSLLVAAELPRHEKGAKQLAALPAEQAAIVVEELLGQLAVSTMPEHLLRALAAAADAGICVEDAVGAIRDRRADITAGLAAHMARMSSEAVGILVTELRSDDQVSDLARATLKRGK